MAKFTKEELKTRSCRRIAEVIHGHVQEGSGIHSRLFEVLIPDEYAIVGESQKGKTYREHVVPCCIIRDACIQMFKDQATIEAVSAAIEKHVAIVLITKEEAKILDNERGWKNCMPPGWTFNEGSIFARLEEAGLSFTLYCNNKKDAA